MRCLRRYYLVSILSTSSWQAPAKLLHLVFVLSAVFHSSESSTDGRGRRTRGSLGDEEIGSHRQSYPSQFLPAPSSHPGGNGSHLQRQQLYLNNIMGKILNFTGRRNVSLPSGFQVEESSLQQQTSTRGPDDAEGWTHLRHQNPNRELTPPPGIQTPPANNLRLEEIKFPPDEVFSSDKDDVFVQFTLHNYTQLRVEVAELVLLLRYNQQQQQQQQQQQPQQQQQQQQAKYRKPEVRRITIEVYRDSENTTHFGNASMDRSRTTSTFLIRKTKWVHVLLMRGWIRDAMNSTDKVLRLRLVYERNGSIDVVMMTPDEVHRPPKRTLGNKRLREGITKRDGRQNIGTGTDGRRKRPSPLLVIKQRRRVRI